MKIILFDFFGTLVEYTPKSYFKNQRKETYLYLQKYIPLVSYELFIDALEKTQDEIEKASIENQKEVGMEMRLSLTLKRLGCINFEILPELTQVYLNEWNKDVQYFEGIGSIINELSKKYKLGIVTNTYYAPLIVYHLRKMKIFNYFNPIITSIEFGYRKPNIKIFEYAIKSLSASPEEVLFVGDSFNDDYNGSKQSGMNSVLVDSKNNYKDERITSIFDLPNYLNGK